MKKFKIVILLGIILLGAILLTGCTETLTSSTEQEIESTLGIGDKLSKNQPTPTDIDYSLERYNLIRRTYWVNGQREKANTFVCEVEKPLGYVALFLENGACAGKFIVDGKISSLNSFLTPDSEYYELVYGGTYSKENKWLPDVDGSYGSNDNGIFFFTPDGKYIEWTGTYLYSDIPFEVKDTVVTYNNEGIKNIWNYNFRFNNIWRFRNRWCTRWMVQDLVHE